MLITVFVCIGFMLAVLYIDLMFDVMAFPYRRSGAPLPNEVLGPITAYYGRITQNPYLLMFVMLTTTVGLVMQLVYGLVPRWASGASLAILAVAIVASSAKVIPSAQRLAAGKEPADVQTRLVHAMLPAHIVLLISMLILAAVQLAMAGRATP